MRSSVSYILSHAPGESVMSHPDYGQHAQHHACLLVLVKGIGGMLKNFNKLWERLQRVNNIKVTGLYTLYTVSSVSIMLYQYQHLYAPSLAC